MNKMAISFHGLTIRGQFTLTRPSLVYCLHQVRYSSSSGPSKEPQLTNPIHEKKSYSDNKGPEWKKLSSKDLGIRTSMIAKSTRVVLNNLKRKGFDVYLVGGCVRDLLLKRIPKDFDVITSAELKEVVRTFPRCQVVGKRFPICHVHVNDTIIEVSSFSTSGRKSGRGSKTGVKKPPGCDEDDFIRWRNCLQRDFTINGLMLDPFSKILYDYVGGVEDIEKARVQSVISAATSFVEDCARILRGVRIAARLGFRFTRETAYSIRELSSSVLKLDKGRILMEMNYMLAYGSAEASLRLLWKFGLLEIVLPMQAAYFVSQGFRRRDKRSNLLLSLFSNLDRLLAPDKPCHCSLWVSILVFHKALADHPRDPLVVAAFSIALHCGASLSEAVAIAKKISQPYDMSFNELLEPGDIDSDDVLINEIMDLSVSMRVALNEMTDENFVSRAMVEYPQAPYSDLVFISMALSEKVRTIFECVKREEGKRFAPKKRAQIDYKCLAMGRLHEVRHLFARIVFDTIYPPKLLNEEGLTIL